ncbi:hypothetical protein ID866_9742 [Astraeus odoratus]|nr:hypothetical protein ID866_9742 [Astraeus odoratus]
MAGGSKQYYITAGLVDNIYFALDDLTASIAPQCPYPDSYIGETLNTVGFDAVYVQFYNNYCGLTNYDNVNAWDFGICVNKNVRDSWAKTVSPNPNVKVYIGAPASSTAAGSGYVSASTLATIIQQTQAQYSSFGGVMLWDASQAYANGRYDLAVKAALTSGGSASSTTTTTKTTATSTTATATTSASASPTTTPGSGSCTGVAAWQSTVTVGDH